MNVLDLFSGIGGFSLGLERAGHKTVAFCEYDDKCRQVLTKHWPDIPKYTDVRQLTGEQLERDGIESIELICGGFPCQPFSVAGNRAGTTDDRHLWPEYLRLIQEIKPRWVIAENVPGILSMELTDLLVRVENKTILRQPDYDLYQAEIIREANMLFDELCGELEKEGYDVLPLIVPAVAVDAKHKRNRVWIIANNESKRERQQEFVSRCAKSPKFAEHGKEQFMANTNAVRLQRQRSNSHPEGRKEQDKRSTGLRDGTDDARVWPAEPGMGRVAPRVSGDVDRLKQLGNSVVPAIPEILGGFIKQIEEGD